VSTSVPNRQLFEQVEHVVNSFCPGLAKMPYHVDRFGAGHHGHEHALYARSSRTAAARLSPFNTQSSALSHGQDP
jgi:hypothetical protein